MCRYLEVSTDHPRLAEQDWARKGTATVCWAKRRQTYSHKESTCKCSAVEHLLWRDVWCEDAFPPPLKDQSPLCIPCRFLRGLKDPTIVVLRSGGDDWGKLARYDGGHGEGRRTERRRRRLSTIAGKQLAPSRRIVKPEHDG